MIIEGMNLCNGQSAAQRSGFSRRLPAPTNATELGAGRDFHTQNRTDLARRQAVGYNPRLCENADARAWPSTNKCGSMDVFPLCLLEV
jgi:hypothetical protein